MGEAIGALYQIPAAYHQMITNAFRLKWAFGRGPVGDKEIFDSMKSGVSVWHEWIVWEECAEFLTRHNVTGCEFREVQHKAYHREDPIDYKKVPTGQELFRRAEAEGIKHGSIEYYAWLFRPEQRTLMDKADEEYFDLLERRSQRRPAPPCWYQLVITSRRVSIVPPTHIGIEPFNDDPEGKKRCILGDPRDHVIGLNILSELSIRESSWDGADVACTESLLGQIITYEDAKRMDDQSRKFMNPIYRENFRGRVAGQSKETWIPGGIRRRLLVISPRLYRLLTEHKLTGFSTEVAHLR